MVFAKNAESLSTKGRAQVSWLSEVCVQAWDAIVVGGSVAGSASAAALAAQGLRVLLCEKAPGRDKACGEGLLPAGVSALERLGLSEALRRARGEPFSGVSFALEQQIAQAQFAHGTAFGVRRQRFDAALLELAAARPGVTLRERVIVDDLWRDEAGRVGGVVFSGGEIARSVLVVGADGLGSKIRARAGLDLGLPRRKRYGLRVHFGVRGGLPFGNQVRVLLDHPGEFYVTPVAPDQVQVAFLGEDLAARGFSRQSFAACVLKHPVLGPLLEGALALGPAMGAGPFGRRARAVVADGLALVGDAAGYVDAVTGEGMELALRSAEVLGLHAARAVAEGARAGSLRSYAKARAAIVRDPDRLTRLVLWMQRYPFVARRGIRALQKSPDLYQKLLSVQGGEAPLSSLRLGDWLRLVAG
jgi:flavin-dependent dehydrogenase